MTNEWQQKFIEKFSSSEIEDIEQAKELKDENIPKSLFKYRGLNEYSLANLMGDTAWCTKLKKYNDPYEGYTTFSHEKIYKDSILNSMQGDCTACNKLRNDKNFVDSLPSDALQKYKQDEQISENKKRELVQKIRSETAACSFAEEYDNILMWSHYADEHKGFCIEYETINLAEFYPIIYSSKILDITQEIVNAFEKKPHSQLFPYYVAIYKDDIWSYEKEWRLILLKDDDADGENFPLKPKAIYLGSQMPDEIKEMFKLIAEEKNITLYEMQMNLDEYKLEAIGL